MTGNRDLKMGGILLAAGGSTRLGQPKQFLEFEGQTLLRRAAEAMCASVCDPVVAVLGAEHEKAEAEITDLRLEMCRNEEWESGMSSSIKLGLKELLKIESEIDAVVITLCDQPFVNSETIDRLAAKFAETKTQMVAAKYDGLAGVPALFSNEMFDALSRIEGDKGARDLLRDPSASVATIEINEAAIDIDSPDDVDRLKPL
jgi:molybdenum cofactor cytidylyltransferase